MEWLANLRRHGQRSVPLEPGKELYTAHEAGAVLGIKPASVGTAVRRHRLEAMGQGKARRFPRSTIEILHERLSQGISMQTTNYYLSHHQVILPLAGEGSSNA
jgi:hypothetical protein